jgi:lipid-A-disaccharide synthase
MNRHAPCVFVVAGEPSGDVLGGRLMAALREMTEDRATFAGVGGPAMAGQGLDSLFPMEELSVMGVAEVLPHLPRLIRRVRETAAAVDAVAPDIVVTIDAPSFADSVVKRIRSRSIPRVHYVAPTVWAWRPWRVGKIRRNYNAVLALLPFEPPFFERAGVRCDFVGHPVVEYGAGQGDGAAFRARHGIAAADTLICVLPGSRRGEVTRHSAAFGGALALLAQRRPGLRVVVPTVPGVAGLVKRLTSEWPVAALVVEGEDEKYAAMAASDAAIAASGTVALELGIAGVPSVIAYILSPATALLLRLLVRVQFASILNIILGRAVVPERLQAHCTAENLAADIERLLGPDGEAQIEALAPALAALGTEGEPPSRRAARAVLDMIG